MGEGERWKQVRLPQVRYLPEFSCLKVHLRVRPASQRYVLTEAERERLKGWAAEQMMAGKYVFDDEVVAIDAGSLENIVAK